MKDPVTLERFEAKASPNLDKAGNPLKSAWRFGVLFAVAASLALAFLLTRRAEPTPESGRAAETLSTETNEQGAMVHAQRSNELDALRQELQELQSQKIASANLKNGDLQRPETHEVDSQSIGVKTSVPVVRNVSSGISTPTGTGGSKIVAEKYLKAIHLHQWNEAADLVATESLEKLKWFQRTHLFKAPTIKDEQDLLRLLGIEEISDIDHLAPRDVFIRRGQAKTNRLAEPDKYIEEIGKNVVLKTLGVVPDRDASAHVIIRKEFIARNKAYSELAFISVVKEGKEWRVSLDAQEPTVRNGNTQK